MFHIFFFSQVSVCLYNLYCMSSCGVSDQPGEGILNLTESVSEGFPSYSHTGLNLNLNLKILFNNSFKKGKTMSVIE